MFEDVELTEEEDYRDDPCYGCIHDDKDGNDVPCNTCLHWYEGYLAAYNYDNGK